MMTPEQKDKLLESFGDYLAARASSPNSLRERNRAKIAKHTIDNADMKKYRERMKKAYGIDPMTDSDKFPVMKEGFSWTKFRDKLEEQLNFREADSVSAFGQFLVAGLLQNINGMYTTAKVSYQDWVHVVTTNLLETPVAPLHGLSFPREVGEQSPYPVVKTGAMSLKFRARKFGSMYEASRELIDDDQSGQFKQQTGMLGEYLQLLTEVLCYGKLASVSAASYSGFTPGVSETQPSGESNWPYATSTQKFIGGGYNRPTSFGALTDANLKAGINALGQQKNILGILLPINPNRIVVGVYYQFDVAVLLNSAYYPAGAQNAGVTGGAFSINPLKGVADATIAPFMGDNSGNFASLSKAWYVMDDSKPWFQLVMRNPIHVEQENPQAGASFDRDIYRFKANTRCNADFVDARFVWQGSDGSA